MSEARFGSAAKLADTSRGTLLLSLSRIPYAGTGASVVEFDATGWELRRVSWRARLARRVSLADVLVEHFLLDEQEARRIADEALENWHQYASEGDDKKSVEIAARLLRSLPVLLIFFALAVLSLLAWVAFGVLQLA